MRGKSSCRKHNIHSRQPPEKHKTKTRKQHKCKWLKNTEDSQKQTNIYLGKDGSTALERSVTNVTGVLKPGL